MGSFKVVFVSGKKHWVAGLAIALIMYLGSFICISFNNPPNKNSSPSILMSDSLFAGSTVCKNCHADIYKSYIHTAHYSTSTQANGESIKGSFNADKSHFRYNKFMEVVMEKKDDKFYQTAYLNGLPYQSEQFGITIGSGRKGQTYLYWRDDRLFQLPVSYYVPYDSWCNSPGYSASIIYYDRPIIARCFECHGTYAKVEQDGDSFNHFDSTTMLYGVGCERCHGPSAAHVAYHEKNPAEKKAKYVTNPALLTRGQKLDICALCHSGYRKAVQPSFSFFAGDELSKFSKPSYNEDSSSWLDVHGNQYGLMVSSKCFKSSAVMDCSSCHNVHVNQYNQPQVFSRSCLNCHSEAAHNSCTLPEVKERIGKIDCIECHMPLLPSKKIFLQLDELKNPTPDLVRTHKIAIYPEKTKQVLALWKKAK